MVMRSKGIIIERAYSSMNPLGTNNQGDLFDYRNLVFTPYPTPPDVTYNSERAVAFSFGYNCPPYWPPNGEGASADIGIGLNSMYELVRSSPVYFEQQGRVNFRNDLTWLERLLIDNDWLQILIAILAGIGIIFGGREVFNMVAPN